MKSPTDKEVFNRDCDLAAALKPPYTIEPLDGKYYGTIILDGEGDEFLKIWGLGHQKYPWHPSRRITDPYDDMFCDSHWESAEDLAVAEAIVATLNRL